MYTCINCKTKVREEGDIGTKNRNHCPFCLHGGLDREPDHGKARPDP